MPLAYRLVYAALAITLPPERRHFDIRPDAITTLRFAVVIVAAAYFQVYADIALARFAAISASHVFFRQLIFSAADIGFHTLAFAQDSPAEKPIYTYSRE